MKLSKTNRRLMAALLCGALILGSGALPTKVDAASSSEIQGQIDELQRKSDEFDAQLSELEQQKNANLDDINSLIDEKMRLDKEVFLLYSQIDNMNEQIAAYGVMIADQQQKLDEATARYQELSEKNLERVRTMEEDGSLSYWSVLFKASSFADFLDRLNMIEEINARKAAEAAAQAEELLVRIFRPRYPSIVSSSSLPQKYSRPVPQRL